MPTQVGIAVKWVIVEGRTSAVPIALESTCIHPIVTTAIPAIGLRDDMFTLRLSFARLPRRRPSAIGTRRSLRTTHFLLGFGSEALAGPLSSTRANWVALPRENIVELAGKAPNRCTEARPCSHDRGRSREADSSRADSTTAGDQNTDTRADARSYGQAQRLTGNRAIRTQPKRIREVTGSPPAYPYKLSPPASPIGSCCVNRAIDGS